ncbi:hypothetical protein BH23VER1_BH23VER1_20840 [soil metagenome]
MARHPFQRTSLPAWSVAAGAVTMAMGAQVAAVDGADGSEEQWPAAWREAYAHFQDFIRLREHVWPQSHLEISEDGDVTSADSLSVQWRQSFSFFRDGEERLSRTRTATHLTKLFRPADYQACVEVLTPLGYQHLPPLLHVRGVADETGAVRWISSPAPEGDGRWPNWRGLLFLDFHVMPASRNPNDIHDQNSRVSPAVRLQVDRDAVLRRPLFGDESFEDPLHWRIYRRGELRESGKASGAAQYACDFGPGFHLAFLAVVGPDGFLPVSNLVPFFVHEGTKDERPSLLPADTDGDRIPDYLELRHEFDPDDPDDANEDADADGLSNANEIRSSIGPRNFIDIRNPPSWFFVGEKGE